MLVEVTGGKAGTAITGIVGENEANLPGKGLLAGHAHLKDGKNVAAKTVVSLRTVEGKIGAQDLLRESIEAEGIVAHREGKGGVGLLAENEGLRGEGGAVDVQGRSGATVATVAAAVLRRLDAPDDTGTTAAPAAPATALKQSIITEGDVKDGIRRGVR